MLDQDKIGQQAKKIMDEFMAALNKLEGQQPSIGFEQEDFVRESKQCAPDPAFKERMLKNAPKRKDDFLVAEKKHW